VKKIVEDPIFWRRFAFANAIFCVILWFAAEFSGWVLDTAFVSRVSMYALILAALCWWQSSRVEVKQASDKDVQEVFDLLKQHMRETNRKPE
jgi:hypothetical protein